MKIKTALIILVLLGVVCAQEHNEVYLAISRAFCVNVRQGRPCKVSQPFNSELEGVCCNGNCHFKAEDCREPMDMDVARKVYDIFQRYACREQEEGQECVIPPAVIKELGYKLKGTCCGGLCRYGIKSCGSFCGDGYCTDRERRDGNCMEDCTGEYIRDDKPRKDDMSIEEQMNALKLITCLGAEDGEECILPADLDEEFGLTGVCCGGECNYRKTRCEEIDTNKPDLIVSSIDVRPENPDWEEKVDVTVTVENVGEAPTKGGFWILMKIHDGDTLLTEENHEVRETVDAGDSITHTFTDKLGLGREGSFRIKAEADMNSNFDHQSNLIEEGDEDNNGGSKVIYVAAAVDEDKDICGDGYCSDQEQTEGICPEDCEVEEGQEGLRSDEMMALLAIIFGFAIVVSIIVFLIRSKKKVTRTGEATTPKTVEELQGEKDELEKMMAIAKAKYHKRELDEESFREIIRDNQKKVIELELKIKAYEP